MEKKINEENNILSFVSAIEKHLQSNQYQELFLKIRHIRTKYIYFLFQFNFGFGSFIKPWRNKLCIWTILQERVDLECNFWCSLPFKLTNVGEVWWPSNNMECLCSISQILSFTVLTSMRNQAFENIRVRGETAGS